MATQAKAVKMRGRSGIATGKVSLLVATRKGLWILTSNKARDKWRRGGPHFLGHIVHHAVLDPRDGKTLLAAAKTGHLGPTVFRSHDGGASWEEAKQPPAFKKAADGQGRSVDHVFWLTPGHADEPDVWYAGTSPQGLFRSSDGGVTWEGVDGYNEHPQRKAWCGDDQDGTPDGAKLHSILVDPRDPAHLYISQSGGGTFESLDRGASWAPLNAGVRAEFSPDMFPEFGQDPHCVRLHPLLPDRLYQQNHCGIFRLDRPSRDWTDIGAALNAQHAPEGVRYDIGFPMVLHPRDPERLWVFPMDGSTVWPRLPIDGKPVVFHSTDGGVRWRRQAKGMPTEQAWWTVKRQAMTADAHDPVGVYFGTTSGEVWGSLEEGKSWACLLRHLPHIYAVEAAEFR